MLLAVQLLTRSEAEVAVVFLAGQNPEMNREFMP